MLWRRAAASRKDMKGIQQGIDKVTTLKVLNSSRLNTYDQGVLRSVLAGGITTQVSKCRAHVAPLTACPFCWQEAETIEHLFWSCPMWQQVRLSFLSLQQLHACIDLPLCTRRTGIFPLSVEQADAMCRIHNDPNLPSSRHVMVLMSCQSLTILIPVLFCHHHLRKKVRIIPSHLLVRPQIVTTISVNLLLLCLPTTQYHCHPGLLMMRMAFCSALPSVLEVRSINTCSSMKRRVRIKLLSPMVLRDILLAFLTLMSQLPVQLSLSLMLSNTDKRQ